jgi:hypothetical protein
LDGQTSASTAKPKRYREDLRCIGVRDVIRERNRPLWICVSEVADEVLDGRAVAHRLLVDVEDTVHIGDEMMSCLALVHHTQHVPGSANALE